MLALHDGEVGGQRGDHACRQQGHAVLAALAVLHGQLVAVEVDVLDPQARALQEPTR